MEIDHTLVDAHLEAIPGLGTFTARSLPGGDSQSLGWHPDGSLNFEFLVLGSLDEVGADRFEALDVPGGQDGISKKMNYKINRGCKRFFKIFRDFYFFCDLPAPRFERKRKMSAVD